MVPPQSFFTQQKPFDGIIRDTIRTLMEEESMPEPLPEHQKTQLVIRSPLSTDGFVSIYFSSPDGRLMSEEEWWNLRQLIELTNKVCVKQQARAQSA
jgi:hypothetical protein